LSNGRERSKKLEGRVARYLWLGGTGDQPIELTLFRLRKDIYHCTASELEEVPWEDVATDIAILNGIARAEK
jgi:hypothetical protein